MNVVPNRFFQLSLIFLVALNLVPHFSLYTVPTLAVGGLCLMWRFLYEFQKVPLPNVFTKIALVITLTYLVYENYGQLLGLESGSALLICAVSLKLIDHVGYRDAMVLLFLNFMLLLSRFLESQTLGITIFAGFDLIITTALLVQLHNGSRIKFDIWSLFRTGSKLVLQITPFMILLFFVFPRFSGNLIKAGSKQKSTSGFKETLEPGSIDSLIQSDQIALRANFYDQEIKVEDMYWRGTLLSESHGMKWNKGIVKLKKKVAKEKLYQNSIKHEILLEPLFNDWLFALDRPLLIDQRSVELQRITLENQGSFFSLSKNYHKKFVYDAYSNEEYFVNSESLNEDEGLKLKYLKVVLDSKDKEDNQVLALVKSISENSKTSEDIAKKLMFFYQKQFKYTLKPGKLKTNTLGEFLFKKKVGFCEHFAASFASVMRLAGVPSRIVLGFHGGRKNEFSNYYIVTTNDAHAWAEVWSKEKNTWIRYDPTEVVAPLRLSLGGEIYHSLSDAEKLEVKSNDYLANFKSDWFNKSMLAVDAIATNWNLFLLSYDSMGQKGFFARLGFDNIDQNMLLLFSLLILLCYFLWVRLKNKPNAKKETQAQIIYLKLRRKLEGRGVIKKSHEGPKDFLERCQQELPHAKEELNDFLEIYLKSEYGLLDFGKNLNNLFKKIKV